MVMPLCHLQVADRLRSWMAIKEGSPCRYGCTCLQTACTWSVSHHLLKSLGFYHDHVFKTHVKNSGSITTPEKIEKKSSSNPTRWCPSSLAKLVNITPISLWFMADITIDTIVFMGFINQLIKLTSLGGTILYPHYGIMMVGYMA